MKIKRFEVGPLFVNSYVVYDEKNKSRHYHRPGR